MLYCNSPSRHLSLKGPLPAKWRWRRLSCRSEASRYDVAVVGGGAAGLTAAYFAAREGAEVIVVEKNPEAGRKILISGGTRCNVLPLAVDQRDYFTESSPSALRAVLASWTHEECLHWLSHREHLGIPLSLEQETAKYFPASNSAHQVRDALVEGCRRRGVALRFGTGLCGLRPLPEGGWACEVEGGEAVHASRVVIATGGQSFPKLGATGVGFEVAARLGHKLRQPYPALTPLLGRHPGKQLLAGVSLYGVQLTCVQRRGGQGQQEQKEQGGPQGTGAKGEGRCRGGGNGGEGKGRGQQPKEVRAERSGLLFTHRGFSGPAVLDLSHYVIKALERGVAPPELFVNWTDEARGMWEQRLAGGGSAAAANLLRKHGIPQRLAEALCQEAGVPADRKLSELKRGERESLLACLTCWPLPVTGHEGYGKAEVTGGGVPLNEVDCTTLESRLALGVHMCGEVLDVFGRIGGFNFYWAWLTGRAAGVGAARGALETSSGVGEAWCCRW